MSCSFVIEKSRVAAHFFIYMESSYFEIYPFLKTHLDVCIFDSYIHIFLVMPVCILFLFEGFKT